VCLHFAKMVAIDTIPRWSRGSRKLITARFLDFMLPVTTMCSRAAALALTALAMGCSGGPPAPADARPDLILVVVDTWRWDALGANGSAREGITPNLDALAARGVRFSRAFASSPWTLPSVASILTGHYPTVHGAFGRFKDVASIRAGIPTLAEQLAGEGYRTVAVLNAPFLDPAFGFDRGFETASYIPATIRRLRRAGPSVDASLDLVGGGDDPRPVFLLLHLFDPHLAYDPPPPWDTRWTSGYAGPLRPPVAPLKAMRAGTFDPSPEDLAYVLALYHGEVGYVDGEVARFLEGFEALRPGRERLVAITADHGEEFGEHGGWEHGHAMYRELVQVPLLVLPPAGLAVAPAAIDAQVRLVDLAPTFLEVAGATSPAGLAGRSLVPMLVDPAARRDLPAYSEREHLGRPSASLRDGHRTLVLYLDEEGGSGLYDPIADPAEIRNLADLEPERVREMEEALRRFAAVLERQARDLGEGREPEALDPELMDRLRSLGYVGG